MKFTYAYKTSDGVRHEAAMDAPSREAVFEALRARGIRPIKVVAADGSKANGEESRRGSRLATRVLLVLAVALVLLVPLALLVLAPRLLENRSNLFSNNRSAAASVASFLDARTRRYPIGDAAVIEKGILTGWSDVFEREGERFLASFAVPGVRAGQRNTTAEELAESLARRVDAAASDGIEARQIKAMVEGMKAEARAYVAAGGNLLEYGKRLTERQDAEIAIYERAKADLEAAKGAKSDSELIAFWQSLNDRLRNLGIRSIPLDSLK